MITETINNFLSKFNIALTTHNKYQNRKEFDKDLEDLMSLPNEKLERLVRLRNKSKAQRKQDLFVLLELDFKREGYFVEFGATNGIDLSNTHILEKEFDWTGILAEPARSWHKDLFENRKCHIEKDCVWTSSNATLSFSEVNAKKELSTITDYRASDFHKKTRKGIITYSVNTISLNDLLNKYNAPNYIDYLSIDTEGSEYEILSNLDFSRYNFRVITCEHNYTKNRAKIFNLLKSKGYKRKYLGFSKFDDWYILEE